MLHIFNYEHNLPDHYGLGGFFLTAGEIFSAFHAIVCLHHKREAVRNTHRFTNYAICLSLLSRSALQKRI